MDDNVSKANFYIDQRPYHKHLELFVSRSDEHQVWVAKPLEFFAIDPFEVAPSNPAMQLTGTDAQALMDELYRAGIRPTRMENSFGALAATERHLKDMQAIAFGVLATEVRMANEFRQKGGQLHEEILKSKEVKAP